MRTVGLIAVLILLCGMALGQTPTFVQATSCPNSGAISLTGGGDYICQLPELTLANNLVVAGVIYDNSTSPTLTVTTINGSGTTVDTMTQVVTNTTANANVQRIYKVATAGGAKAIKFHISSTTGFVAAQAAEFYNVNTTASGTAVCNRVSSTTVTTGNITVGSGNLLVMSMFPDDTTASGSLTAGSSMTFADTDRNDSEAIQYRLGTGSAINPTITQGTSHQTAACAAGFTAAAVGTAPTTSFRVLHLAHAQMPAGSANPFVIQVPVAGNLAVMAFHSGGDSISSISDTGSNSWTCGTAHTGTGNTSQICYATITSTSNTLAISVTRSGTTSDGTMMTYDITGAASSSPHDTGTGGTGSTSSTSSPLTVCSSCFTPGAQNELIFATSGWDFCTATGASAPSGALFDSATYVGGVNIDGPQPVDQNNGWSMYRNSSSLSALSVAWVMNCTGTSGGGAGIGNYAWSIDSFKPPASSSVPDSSEGGISF